MTHYNVSRSAQECLAQLAKGGLLFGEAPLECAGGH